MKHALLNLKKNKGSGIVTVMVAVLFLTAFGTLSLYLTYTSTEMVSAERKGAEADYNAAACMEQIRTGMKIIESDAISLTYNEIMPDFVKYNQDVSDKFKASFMQKIADSKVIDYDSTLAGDGSIKYFDQGLMTPTVNTSINAEGETVTTYSNGTYNAGNLANLVREKRGGTCNVYSDSTDNSNVGTLQITDKKIILKGIKVDYIDKTGRKSSVTSDITLGIPNIGYLFTQFALPQIPDFTLICGGTLKQTTDAGGKQIEVKGSAYAGDVVLSGSNRMALTGNSTLFIRNKLLINDSPSGDSATGGGTMGFMTRETYGLNNRFRANAGSTVWAHDIEIGDMGSAELFGETRVKNDIKYTGIKGKVTLAGSYYGFGCSETDYNESSSIIFNKPTGATNRNKLSFTSTINSVTRTLNNLTLAGVSFISNGGRYEHGNEDASEDNNISVRTGMSIGTKYNQIIYFAPKGSVQPYEYIIAKDDEGDLYYAMQDEIHYAKVTDDGSHPMYVMNEEGHLVSSSDAVPYNPKVRTGSIALDTDGITFFTSEQYAKIAYFALTGETYEYDADENRFVLTERSTADFPSGSDMAGKKYSDYGISLQPIVENLPATGEDPNPREVTFFLKFNATGDDPEHSAQGNANRYFFDYYDENTANAEKINGNLEAYVDLLGQDLPLYSLTGNAFSSEGLIQAEPKNFAALRERSEFIGSMFENAKKTLSNTYIETTAQNPFEYYINSSKIEEDIPDGGRLVFYAPQKDAAGDYVRDSANDNKIVYAESAVIVRGDYVYDNDEPGTLCMIIATGNVTVERSFSGLIFAAGNVSVVGNITLNRYADGVEEAYFADTVTGTLNGDHLHNSTATVGAVKDRLIKDYFNASLTEGQSSATGSVEAWNIDDLVAYENYHR